MRKEFEALIFEAYKEITWNSHDLDSLSKALHVSPRKTALLIRQLRRDLAQDRLHLAFELSKDRRVFRVKSQRDPAVRFWKARVHRYVAGALERMDADLNMQVDEILYGVRDWA